MQKKNVLAEEGSSHVLGELWRFMAHNKKWWLTPVILLMLLLSVLVVLGSGGAAPFIYTLF